MSFPLNPINGDETYQNGIKYVYSAATNSWRRDKNRALDQLVIVGTYTSTSTHSGALAVYGGIGIGENLIVGSSWASLTTSSDNAVYVVGGVGIDNSLYVGGPALFNGSVTFGGTATFVSSTNTIYTDNILELHYPSTGSVWTLDDGKDIGIRFHYFTNSTDTNAALVLANDTKMLEWYSSGAEGTSTFTSGEYGGIKTGYIQLTSSTNAINSTTGALTVAGGVGIVQDLWVGGTIYQHGVPVSNGGIWSKISSDYLSSVGDLLFVDTSTSTVTVTLPSSPVMGNTVEFIDYAGTFASNNLIFDGNGELIFGSTSSLIVNVSYAGNTLIYSDSTQGWKLRYV